MKQAPATGGKPAVPVFAKKRDIVILAALLAAALLLWLGLGALKRGRPGADVQAVVTVSYDDVKYTEYIDMSKEQIVEIDARLPVRLQVMEGGVCFIESVCPDHDCERFGVLTQEGDWAACLPAGVSVRVEGAG